MTITTRFAVSGMTCQACANRIEKVLGKKAGVDAISVNFASEEASVTFNEHSTNHTEICHWIGQTGFSATAIDDDSLPALNPPPVWRLLVLLVLSSPFMVGMLGMMLGHHRWMPPVAWQFALASIVQWWLMLPFYRSAWAALRSKMANMDVLVVLGTSAIYLYSSIAFLSRSAAELHIYFEASVMIVTFISIGKYLEERNKRHSLNSLGLMLKMTPEQVRLKRDNAYVHTALDQVVIGDTLQANHGERIAADGIVLSGEAWCDESHLTGEAKPISKRTNDRVLAGAIVSNGSLSYRAEQLGKDTHLGDMMQALAQAQGSKAPIARIADSVAAVFVPVVVSIALLTFVLTWLITANAVSALIHAVAVLVIACPCALGLATPAAIMVGMGQAVRHGVWFKDAAALEQCSAIDSVVLDKTGTLTAGKLSVEALWLNPDSDIDATTLYAITAAVEAHAQHPLAQALLAAASAKSVPKLEASHAETIVGKGIRAQVEGHGSISIGSPDFTGFKPSPDLPNIWQQATIVAVNIKHQTVGAFALIDSIKSDSHSAIQRLQQLGINIHIMSGDAQSVVDHIAQSLGITHAQGNMSPRDKAQAINQLKQQGHKVAMVGDGINDAPALASAHVSFAMKDGASIAEHTADATLMRQSVDQVADALHIARATLKTIKQNLFFAFIYNIIGIPLAAFGLLTPIIAAAAMAMSSLSVIGNAIRLKYLKLTSAPACSPCIKTL